MKSICTLLLALAASSAAVAQPGGHGTPVLTRYVKIFADLENQLAAAAGSHDEAKLAKLLAANFEEREAATPGTPVPRVDWLGRAHAAPEISQMAVHDYGNIAVVSFADAAQHAFVVDVWSKTADGYALSVRYASGAAAAPQTKPENPAK